MHAMEDFFFSFILSYFNFSIQNFWNFHLWLPQWTQTFPLENNKIKSMIMKTVYDEGVIF